jgi:hypothetical protein
MFVKSSGDNVRKAYKLGLAIYIVLVLVLIPAPERVHARWPPFSFYLTPSYDNGKMLSGSERPADDQC